MTAPAVLKVSRAEFMADAGSFIGRDTGVEVLNDDGSTLIYIAGKPPRRHWLIEKLEHCRLEIWIWWQCRGVDRTAPLDTSWLE